MLYGAFLVAVGVMVATRRHGESQKATTAQLDAWWLAMPAGLMVAFGGIRTDPLLFAAFARWGTGWARSHLPTLLRRVRDDESEPASSTV